MNIDNMNWYELSSLLIGGRIPPRSVEKHIDGWVQDCSISSALASQILQSCNRPSIWPSYIKIIFHHIEAETKWLPFCKRCFQMQFLNEKYFISILTCVPNDPDNKSALVQTSYRITKHNHVYCMRIWVLYWGQIAIWIQQTRSTFGRW